MNVTAATESSRTVIETRVAGYDWQRIAEHVDAHGWARLPRLLEGGECADVAAMYSDARLFRSHIVMARHGFGRGEYKYFAYALPPTIEALRRALYKCVAPISNKWNKQLRLDMRYPPSHEEYLNRCHAAGQKRPTPLLLQYGPEDFNALHQDVYGDEVFPLQTAILLSAPDIDFTGGEFVLIEQRPRIQSRVEVVPLERGDGVVFAVSHRPAIGTRGTYRVNLRHGVSRLRSGQRHALGIIFHDAK